MVRLLKSQIKNYCLLSMSICLSIILSACGSNGDAGEEAETKAFGIDLSQEEPMVWSPEQIVCGDYNVWIITSVKNDDIYMLDYGNDSIGAKQLEWQQAEAEYITNIAERRGTLYAEIHNTQEGTIEIRKYSAGVSWKTIMTIGATDEAWSFMGSGLFVDGSENVYLVSGDTVTRFSAQGEKLCEYKLGGNPGVFLENNEGYVECITAGANGITLYELKENKAEEKWTLKTAANRVYGVKSNEEDTLCLAAETELLFVDRVSGSLVAQSNLTMMGLSSLLSGKYDASEGILWAYGKSEANTGVLVCSLLSERDPSAEQRTEIVYGTLGVVNRDAPVSIKTAIMEFNKTNEHYYVTIRNYYSEEGLDVARQRLNADMAVGNGPDIIDMWDCSYYLSYVNNGYLENLSPYLEQSKYKDDIIWNVLNTYEVDGGIYLFLPQFYLGGVRIHPDYAQYVEEWNMETFYDLIERCRWEKYIYTPPSPAHPESLLYYVLSGRQEEFIHLEEKTAEFESPEFLDMLAMCKEYAEKDLPAINGILDKNLWLLSPDEFTRFSDYVWDVDLYGRDHQVYGFPTISGEAYQIGVAPDVCAIYAGSKNKEGAWEFVESLMEEPHQRMNGGGGIAGGFPIRSSIMKALEEEEVSVGKVGEDGKHLTMSDSEFAIMENIFYNGNLIGEMLDYRIWDVIREETPAYFAGDKTAEDVAHIIQSKVYLILNE